jgi:hypothetical protein
MRFKILSVILIATILLAGCAGVFASMYGMKRMKSLDENAIIRTAIRYHAESGNLYTLKPSYLDFLKQIDTTKYRLEQKNHHQPLQALYFDSTGKLISFHVNCYCGGFPNLNWDRDGSFARFPPATKAPLDSLLNLEQQLAYLQPTGVTKSFIPDSTDFTVVIYWSRFMGRQSERLIDLVQRNVKLEQQMKTKILYVNTDQFWEQLEEKNLSEK